MIHIMETIKDDRLKFYNQTNLMTQNPKNEVSIIKKLLWSRFLEPFLIDLKIFTQTNSRALNLKIEAPKSQNHAKFSKTPHNSMRTHLSCLTTQRAIPIDLLYIISVTCEEILLSDWLIAIHYFQIVGARGNQLLQESLKNEKRQLYPLESGFLST